jgi:hypothetical protein
MQLSLCLETPQKGRTPSARGEGFPVPASLLLQLSGSQLLKNATLDPRAGPILKKSTIVGEIDSDESENVDITRRLSELSSARYIVLTWQLDTYQDPKTIRCRRISLIPEFNIHQ